MSAVRGTVGAAAWHPTTSFARNGFVARFDRISYTRSDLTVSFYDEIVVGTSDDATCKAHNGRHGWAVTWIGPTFHHFPEMLAAGWLTTINHGPATYGHTTYVLADDIVSAVLPY